ncbi:MAG TPA: serine--tRNA ligase [Polyangiaceae bacterium LLY-WYZ-14_1]|nr:serine--tRNA ligase [Polyangiaceae bacterium LLY-WYZ-14_1]
MLDLRAVVDDLEAVRQGLARRGFDDDAALDELARRADERRRAIVEVEGLRARRNEASQAMAKLDKTSDEFTRTREEIRGVGEAIKTAEARQKEAEARIAEILLGLPNLPHPDTPDGRSEADNPVVRTVGDPPSFDFTPKDHVDLGVGLGILDFERAAKLSGARFVVLKGAGARLERALMSYMLDLHADRHGYQEVWVPALVKGEALQGTGQLPKFEADVFKLAAGWGGAADAPEDGGEDVGRELYLIPTAEVPVTNLHADEILDGAELPRSYCAYTPCFRSEAGSYGRDTRGMIRQHQFDKVELVRFVSPEDGPDELERLTGHAEAVLQGLGLHYRVVQLCAGDMGFAAQKAYDLEVWLPSQQAYREISSCSWFGDFQARRARIRYRPGPKDKPRLLHTLNGSGLAIGRTLVALLEQGQGSDGSVTIPRALRPYLGGRERLEPPA